MCIELNTEMEYSNNKKTSSTSYCIKKLLKAIFKHSSNKKIHTTSTIINNDNNLLESLESLDNLRNSQVEEHYEEIEDNTANEKLLSCIYTNDHHQYEQYPSTNEFELNSNDEEEIFVPVRFARTDAGTFFWTTNLQPATIITRTSISSQSNDMDLINHQAYCYSNSQHQQQQYPELQYQDRWAQA